MKLNITPKYLTALFFLLLFSCSVKNSTLKKGAEMEKLGNFKQASELYLGVLYRKPNLPEIENALRRSAQLHISETAFAIATKNEKGDKEGVVNEYYNLNTFVNQVNTFTKNLDIDQQTKAIYNKNLDQYLIGQYDLGIKYLSEQKFTEAESVFNDISRFNPNYKDTPKQLSIAVNEPVYIIGIQLFGEKKYMPAYEKWNEIYLREANYKDVKNKLQQALNERYKEGSYYLMQENFKEAELAFEQVKNINSNYLDVKNLHREAFSEPIYRKAVKDLKKGKCRTAYLGLDGIIQRFDSYKNSDELKSDALLCAEYPIIVESYRGRNSNGFESNIQNAVIEDILASKNPFVKIIKGSNDISSPYYNISEISKNNTQLKRYIENSYIRTNAKAILTIHINQYQLQDEPVKSYDVNGLEVKKLKARNGADSIVEKSVVYKEYEKRTTLQSNITYRLVEITTGKILMQKTIQKSDEKQIRYARNNNSNFKFIYPTRMIADRIMRDEANYKNLQTLFQTSDQINSQSLADITLTDFRKRIVSEILLFNPEE
jgi:tetratricopeptide (TPR) repeat protein